MESNLRTVRIPFVGNCTKRDFFRNHVMGGGKPAVLSTERLFPRSFPKTTFDYFRTNFGNTIVNAGAPQFPGEAFDLERICRMRLTLADYIDYIEDPSREPVGTWAIGDWERLGQLEMPLYAGDFNPFRENPEHPLCRAVQASPDFTYDWSRYLPPDLRKAAWKMKNHHYVYLSSRMALTPLHYDFWDSHAYLSQVQGRKFCLLFSPTDSENIYSGAIDLPQVDLEKFPLAGKATAWAGFLEEGQTLFIPSKWWHWVVTLEPSITFSHNWFDRTNGYAYLSSLFRSLKQTAWLGVKGSVRSFRKKRREEVKPVEQASAALTSTTYLQRVCDAEVEIVGEQSGSRILLKIILRQEDEGDEEVRGIPAHFEKFCRRLIEPGPPYCIDALKDEFPFIPPIAMLRIAEGLCAIRALEPVLNENGKSS